MNVAEIITAIDGLSVGQMRALTLKLQDKFDVKPVTQQAQQSHEKMIEEIDEQYEFDVTLEAVPAGAEKVKIIKAVREVTNLGLRESKEIVDGAPSLVGAAVTREKAESIKNVLETAGATVAIK